MKSAYNVIKAPVVTEKRREGWKEEEKGRVYTFIVDNSATKPQIKDAVEKAFNVKVSEIKTMIRKGKFRRRRMKGGYTASSKRAIVRLLPNNKISFFDGI